MAVNSTVNTCCSLGVAEAAPDRKPFTVSSTTFAIRYARSCVKAGFLDRKALANDSRRFFRAAGARGNV